MVERPEQVLPPSWNVAPTQDVYAVVERPPRGEPEASAERRLRVVRWGLVPSWAKDPAIGNRMINARMETVAEKPAFRRAFAKRRALLPADGYFEWYGEVKGKKQPFFIRPADGGVLAMAGLYELWRDPAVPPDSDVDPWLWTVTVLTTTATDELGRIHDRMPLLVERDEVRRVARPRGRRPGSVARPARPGRTRPAHGVPGGDHGQQRPQRRPGAGRPAARRGGGGRNGRCGVRRNVRRRWRPAALLRCARSARRPVTPGCTWPPPGGGSAPWRSATVRAAAWRRPTWPRWPPHCPREASPCSGSSSRGGSRVAGWPARRRRWTRRGWRCSRRWPSQDRLSSAADRPEPGWPAARRRSSAPSASSRWRSRCTRRAGRTGPGCPSSTCRSRPAFRCWWCRASRDPFGGPPDASAATGRTVLPVAGRRPLVPGAQAADDQPATTAALVAARRGLAFSHRRESAGGRRARLTGACQHSRRHGAVPTSLHELARVDRWEALRPRRRMRRRNDPARCRDRRASATRASSATPCSTSTSSTPPRCA